jgi:hypothetical protein
MLSTIKALLIRIRDRYFVKRSTIKPCTIDYIPHNLAFSWDIVIEHGTVTELCAIDALLTVKSKDHDMWTYTTNDKEAWNDFERYRIARSKAINKEFMQRYS